MTSAQRLSQLVFAVLVLATAACTDNGAVNSKAEQGQFVAAPDGDTLHVQTETRGLVKVRVAGIDTPERGQAYWRVARAHLISFTKNKPIALDCFKKDRYERDVCRVAVNGEDLGASLVAAGLAWHYKEYQSEQTPEERKRYSALEVLAREKQIGLWQESDPMPPGICRKVRRAGGKCR